MKSALKFIGAHAAQSIVGTVSLAAGFMLFNDYVAPPPDLSGRWKFTVHYNETDFNKFKDMQVTYQALIVQENLSLSGMGEKMSAVGPAVARENYLPRSRVNIDISGYVKNNFFSPDEFVVKYKEGGTIRDSAALHRVRLKSSGSGCGCFQSTIAGTRGLVQWQRIKSTRSDSDPIGQGVVCPRYHCD